MTGRHDSNGHAPAPGAHVRRRMLALAVAVTALLCGIRYLPLAPTQAARAARTAAIGPAMPLQPLIDAAVAGAIVKPPPGRYAGPVVIDKAITVDGDGKVIVDGQGRGTVVSIRTDGATVKGLHVTGSGDQHNDMDAGIRVEGRGNVVRDNTIEESLFGIDLQQASDNIVRRNRISSKGDNELGVKGDAIRLWYADRNRIEDNTIRNSRDLVVWYSSHNVIAGNTVSDGRYGLHFMFAKHNVVEDNRFDRNLVGIYSMYDEHDVIRRNRVFQAQGAAGVGIGFKEASNITVEDNEILYNAAGIALDLSPFEPESTIRMIHNRIAFNVVGVSFLSDREGTIFIDNLFIGNNQHVAMRLFESATRATWNGNYWDDYEGFDLDKDGIGDRPHLLRSYADRLWMDVPSAALFKGSPALSALNFVERLAPFTEPLLLLKDERPRMSKDFKREAPTTPAAKPGAAPQPAEAGNGRLDPFGLYKK